MIFNRTAALAVVLATLLSGCASRPRTSPPDPVQDLSPSHRSMAESFLRENYDVVPMIPAMQRSRFYLNVVINGKPGRFIVDTGADVSILFESSLSKFGLVPEDTLSRKASAIGGIARIGSTRFESFVIAGKIAVEPGRFDILRGKKEADCDGLLGTNILRHLRAVLDFKNNRLYFLPPGTDPQPGLPAVAAEAGMKTLALKNWYGHPMLEVNMKGDTYFFEVDSGAPISVFSSDVADDLDLVSMPRTMKLPGLGEEELDSAILGVPKFVSDRFVFEPAIMISADIADVIAIRNFAGLLGMTLLADNDALFDVGAFRIYFDTQRIRSRFAPAR